MSALHVRPLDPQRDLAALLELVGRSRGRGETSAIFHPGGLQWWLRRIGRSGFEVAVLVDDNELVGMALRDGSDLVVQTDDSRTNDRVELLAWAETRMRENGDPEIFVWVPVNDDDLCRLAVSRDYEPTERYGYELVHDLGAEPDTPDLPRGFEIISLTPALTEAYVALHRAAWSRPSAPSSYDRRLHDAVTTCDLAGERSSPSA